MYRCVEPSYWARISSIVIHKQIRTTAPHALHATQLRLTSTSSAWTLSYLQKLETRYSKSDQDRWLVAGQDSKVHNATHGCHLGVRFYTPNSLIVNFKRYDFVQITTTERIQESMTFILHHSPQDQTFENSKNTYEIKL